MASSHEHSKKKTSGAENEPAFRPIIEDNDIFEVNSSDKFWGKLTAVLVFVAMALYGLHYLQYITAHEVFSVQSPDRRYRAVGYAYPISLSKMFFHQEEDGYLPGYYRLYNENGVVLFEAKVNAVGIPPRFVNSAAIFLTDDGVESIPLRRN